MTDVKRYEPIANCQYGTTDECVDGDYVLFDDHQALQAKNERMWTTFVKVAEYLGIDAEKARHADGKPSDIYLQHINKLKADAVREFLNKHAPKLDPMDENEAFDYPAEYAILTDRNRLHDIASKLEAINNIQTATNKAADVIRRYEKITKKKIT